MGGDRVVAARRVVGASGAESASSGRRDPSPDRGGCPWRDVPDRYGPWSSLYRVFRRYQRDGVGDRCWTRCGRWLTVVDRSAGKLRSTPRSPARTSTLRAPAGSRQGRRSRPGLRRRSWAGHVTGRVDHEDPRSVRAGGSSRAWS
ncbi:transposase [Cellulosimicrobium cellulans]|uniref:transposase n=1 Tax=Cellulosimicrobium cellulans TaxID=1710 RepID=UPI0036EA15E4